MKRNDPLFQFSGISDPIKQYVKDENICVFYETTMRLQ